MKRKLLDGTTTRPEVVKPVICKVETKCPRKWAFVDMEDGNIYIPDGKGSWLCAKEADLKMILNAARAELAEYKRRADQKAQRKAEKEILKAKLAAAGFPIEGYGVLSEEGKALRALQEPCPKGGIHEWGTDGMHSNEFCKKCYKPSPTPGKTLVRAYPD